MGAIAGDDLSSWEEKLHIGSINEEKILVSVRLRPLNEREIARNDTSEWECFNDNTIIFKCNIPDRSFFPSSYTFDRVFSGDCTTRQVYETAAKEVALSVMSGINSCIFAYGQTSSGKTYTMSGITEFAAADIYEYIMTHQEREFVLKFSAIEIYNEFVKDLLSIDGSSLRLLDDPERGTVIEKITEETLRDWNHLQELLSFCETQRQVGETSLNEASSRSHQILRLTIESSDREFTGNECSNVLYASVNFVDLAGSERASQSLSAGTRLKEGCHINRSLLTLGTVIRKLSKGKYGHIPYRDSKLTRILQPCLGGNARTAIICTMSPARSHIEQSRNTLLFASCAKEVSINAQVNVVLSDKALVKHLQKELARMQNQLKDSGVASSMCHYEELLREKDIHIQKIEKEMRELILQRDLAQSQLKDLLRRVTDNRSSEQLGGIIQFTQSETLDAMNDHSITKFSDDLEKWDAMSEGSMPCVATATTINYQYHSQNQDDNHLSSDVSSEDVFTTQTFIDSFPFHQKGGSSQGTIEDSYGFCKEVGEIEIDDCISGKEDSNSSSTIQNENRHVNVMNNVYDMNLEMATWKDYPFTVMDSPQEDKMGNDIDTTVKPCSVKSTLSETELPTTRKFQFTKSASCRASFVSTIPCSPFEKDDGNNTPLPRDFDESYHGRSRRIPITCSQLTYDTSKNTQIPEVSSSTDILNPLHLNISSHDPVIELQTSLSEPKNISYSQYESKLVDSEMKKSEEARDFKTEKPIKDVGLDPIQSPPQSPSAWLIEFEKCQREIIELWHECAVSLIYRTHFFLLFKGDPEDAIYLEMEIRRLSSLRATFSQENFNNINAKSGPRLQHNRSLRALERERTMLSKKLGSRISTKERETLYEKWGIRLESKKRRLQLAWQLWTHPQDMDHIRDSVAVIEKLVTFSEPRPTQERRFSLCFIPHDMDIIEFRPLPQEL